MSIFGTKGSGKSTLVKAILEEHDRVFVFDTLGEYELAVRFGMEACLAACASAEKSRAFAYSFRLQNTEDYLDLMEVCYELPGTLLVLEETSFYCSPASLPAELSTLVRYGRHREIDQIYVARRPSEIHRDLTAQSDIIVSFRQQEPRDIQYLTAAAGQDASRVRNLRPYRCAAWGDMRKAPVALLAQLDRSGEQLALPEPVEEEPAEQTPLTE
jgi:DNA helicase HerA-like ATPase